MTLDGAPGSAEADLGQEGEAEWARLRRQFQLADGFWLGFIFSSSPGGVTTLRRRTEHLLALRPARLAQFLPRQPDELRGVLARLFEPATAEAGCAWVQAVIADRGPWDEAWNDVFLRLNERREALRRHLHAGLVLAGPLSAKPRVREAAPDLWSIRSLVIELPGVARDVGELPSDESASPEVARPANLTLTGRGARELKARLDDVSAALAVGRTEDAVESGRAAVDLVRFPGDDADLVAALTALSRAEEAHGDPAAASDHAREALRRCPPGEDSVRAELLDRIGRLALDRADVDAARGAFEELATIRRRRAGSGSRGSLRDLSVALDWLGRVRQMAGDRQGATEAYEEELALGRRLLDQHADGPEALRALSHSLRHLGDLRRHGGDPAGAARLYEEALGWERRLVEQFGETAGQLQNVAVSLRRLGDLRRSVGDMTGAAQAYEESQTVGRRVIEHYGENPHRLRNLSVTLERLGDVRRDGGDRQGAVEAYEQSLATAERVVDLYGETPGLGEEAAVARTRLTETLKSLDGQGVEGTKPKLA